MSNQHGFRKSRKMLFAATAFAGGAFVAGHNAMAAPGNLVTYTLSLDDNGSGGYQANHYAVYASDSAGNGGLAAYGVNLTQATGTKTINNFSPNGLYDDGTGNTTYDEIGFTTQRETTPVIAGSQDTVSFSSGGNVILVYGMGQTAGNLATDAAPGSTGVVLGPTQASYGANLLLIKGTFAGGAVAFGATSLDGASVFDANSGYAVELPTLAFNTVTLSAPGGAHPIISLVSTAPASNYGVQITTGSSNNQGTFSPVAANNKLTVAGGSGAYTLAQVTGINSGNGDTTDYVEAAGFNPATDKEIFALTVKDTSNAGNLSTELNQLVTDINGSTYGFNATVASLTSPSGAIPGGYNLFLSLSGAELTGSGDNFLGFDLSTANDPNLTDVLTVSSVAVVPEPTVAGLAGFGLLGALGRRKRRA